MTAHMMPSSLVDLNAVEAYLDIHAPGTAQAVSKRILNRISRIAEAPFLGAVVPEYSQESVREVFEQPYRILYRVKESQVDIVAIVHSSRRLPRTLPL